ncbi:hypothetical protein ACLB2K_025850 [Fragaria x ananassa]
METSELEDPSSNCHSFREYGVVLEASNNSATMTKTSNHTAEANHYHHHLTCSLYTTHHNQHQCSIRLHGRLHLCLQAHITKSILLHLRLAPRLGELGYLIAWRILILRRCEPSEIRSLSSLDAIRAKLTDLRHAPRPPPIRGGHPRLVAQRHRLRLHTHTHSLSLSLNWRFLSGSIVAVTTALVPCLTFGQIAEVVDDGNTSTAACATSGLLYGLVAAFSGMPCIVSCAYRTKIRNMYGLVEAPASDWLTHLFCEPCALCQEYKELQRRGLFKRMAQGNAAASGMNVRSHMTPPVINHRMN